MSRCPPVTFLRSRRSFRDEDARIRTDSACTGCLYCLSPPPARLGLCPATGDTSVAGGPSSPPRPPHRGISQFPGAVLGWVRITPYHLSALGWALGRKPYDSAASRAGRSAIARPSVGNDHPLIAAWHSISARAGELMDRWSGVAKLILAHRRVPGARLPPTAPSPHLASVPGYGGLAWMLLSLMVISPFAERTASRTQD